MMRRGWAVLSALLLLVGACGIPLDAEPEVIAADDLPAGLRPTTSTTSTRSSDLSGASERATAAASAPTCPAMRGSR